MSAYDFASLAALGISCFHIGWKIGDWLLDRRLRRVPSAPSAETAKYLSLAGWTDAEIAKALGVLTADVAAWRAEGRWND